MCATMKYVSWIGMSTGVAAMNTPDSPPMTNMATNPIAFSIGTWKRRLPRHIVPIQLNTLIADGTEMIMVVTTGWARCRSEEHTSELQSHSDLVCRLLLEKKKKKQA